ncbi:hypothetical protein GGI13_004322 [Coemansia sp. RSA 455]|nr:hypothetical protein GGI13_004322 [Coemansia sp. RSA 455]
MSRSYPIYHVHNEGERLGVSLTTINNTTKLLHRPIVIDGIALAWTYVDGSIPIPITICNAPRCPKDQLVAAFRAYGRLLHLEKLCAPNAPHTGNWSAILILKPEAECPTSIVFRQSNTPMKIIPFTNAEMCPTCYHADPSACVCPAPACHPAHIRHVPDEQAQASPPTNAMPTNPTTSAPAPDLVSFSNIPPVDEMAITAPAIPVSDNTMDVDNQASVAPAHNTGSPDATQAVSSDNASQPNATTVPSTSIRSDQLSTNNHPHRKTTSHNTPLDKHVGHATPLAKRGSDQAITPSNEGYHGTPKKMVAMGKDRPKTATSTMLRNRPPSLAISLSSLVQGQTIEPSSPLHTPNNDKSKAPANHIDIATQSPTHAYNAQSGATHSEPRMDSDNSLTAALKANPIQTKPNTSYNNPLERPETGSTQE